MVCTASHARGYRSRSKGRIFPLHAASSMWFLSSCGWRCILCLSFVLGLLCCGSHPVWCFTWWLGSDLLRALLRALCEHRNFNLSNTKPVSELFLLVVYKCSLMFIINNNELVCRDGNLYLIDLTHQNACCFFHRLWWDESLLSRPQTLAWGSYCKNEKDLNRFKLRLILVWACLLQTLFQFKTFFKKTRVKITQKLFWGSHNSPP